MFVQRWESKLKQWLFFDDDAFLLWGSFTCVSYDLPHSYSPYEWKNWVLNQKILIKASTWAGVGEYAGIYVSYKPLKNDIAPPSPACHSILFRLA